MDTRDKQNRFPTDQMLRNNGYEIRDRPAKGEPIWRHKSSGEIHTQSEAVAFCAWRREQQRKGNEPK